VRKKTISIPKIPIGSAKPLAVSDKSPLSDRSNKSPKERGGLYRIKSTSSISSQKIVKSSTHLKVPAINENSPITQEKQERTKKKSTRAQITRESTEPSLLPIKRQKHKEERRKKNNNNEENLPDPVTARQHSELMKELLKVHGKQLSTNLSPTTQTKLNGSFRSKSPRIFGKMAAPDS